MNLLASHCRRYAIPWCILARLLVLVAILENHLIFDLVSHVLDVHIDTIGEIHIVLKHMLQIHHRWLRLLATSHRVLLLLAAAASYETLGSLGAHLTKSSTVSLVVHNNNFER